MIKIWEKKYIVKKISEIQDKNIFMKIYQIVLDHDIKHTKNNNGIFININAIEDDKLIILKDYLYSI
jgi:hypothetical protein